MNTRTLTSRLMQLGAITAVAALTLSACAGRDSGGSTGTTDASSSQGSDITQVVSPDDCTDYQASPGITDTEIKLGSSFPNSGPLASIGEANQGMEAYFDYLNDTEGGINGRKITLIGKDDQYDATKAVANVNELLQKDGVFAIVGVQSSVGATSVWDDLKSQCVPLLMSTLSGTTLQERQAHPNALDGLVPYAAEAYALGQYAASEWDSKKIGLIAQSGIFGESFLRGLRTIAEEKGMEIVDTETYDVTDATVTAQLTNLRASGADTLFVASAGTKCPQIFDGVKAAGWDPHIATTFTCSNSTLLGLAKPDSVNGLVSDTWLRFREAGDTESDAYFDAVAKYFPKLNAGSENTALGWAQGQVIAKVLEQATDLTRVGVINSALSLHDAEIGMAAPGVLINTSADSPIPALTVQVTEYDSASKKWGKAPGDESLFNLQGVLEKTDK